MSGFTATGATILTDIEALDSSLLMWRQFTQWLGGMGIIVLAVAVLPRLRVGGRQLLQSELAGPTEVERLTATIRETARRLWVLYVALTLAAIAILTFYGWIGLDDEMDLYEATAQAFSTLAIGGFSTQEESVAAFAAATQWTILLFLVLAGINFLRLYLVLVRGRLRAVTRDDEFRLYLAFLAAGSILLLVELLAGNLADGEEAVREAVFQAVSIMTTAGFATADYTEWSALARADPARPHVPGRVGRIDGRVDQGRPSPAHVPHHPAGAGADGPPRGRSCPSGSTAQWSTTARCAGW